MAPGHSSAEAESDAHRQGGGHEKGQGGGLQNRHTLDLEFRWVFFESTNRDLVGTWLGLSWDLVGFLNQQISMDWLKGKFIGNPWVFKIKRKGFPVNFPIIQFYENRDLVGT